MLPDGFSNHLQKGVVILIVVLAERYLTIRGAIARRLELFRRAAAERMHTNAGRRRSGVESSSRTSALPSRRSTPAASGTSAAAMSRNTCQRRLALASDRVERGAARRLRW